MIKSRSTVASGWKREQRTDCKGKQGTFLGDKNVLYQDCDGSNDMTIYLTKFIELYTINWILIYKTAS